jgi:hypothetical protein
MRKIREILRLRYDLGLCQDQIARSCNIGQSTVHRYLERFCAHISGQYQRCFTSDKVVAAIPTGCFRMSLIFWASFERLYSSFRFRNSDAVFSPAIRITAVMAAPKPAIAGYDTQL